MPGKKVVPVTSPKSDKKKPTPTPKSDKKKPSTAPVKQFFFYSYKAVMGNGTNVEQIKFTQQGSKVSGEYEKKKDNKVVHKKKITSTKQLLDLTKSKPQPKPKTKSRT